MVKNSSMIVGGDPNKRRRKLDFYPTPPEVTLALLKFLNLPQKTIVWECACGNGAMVDVMEHCGYSVIATDIAFGSDFLTAVPQDADWIITNPPFSLAENFILRAAQHKKPFALLLESQFWNAKKRYVLFQKHPPTFILPLTWRPDFTGQKASLLDMIWCVWERPIDAQPITRYIPLRKPEI